MSTPCLHCYRRGLCSHRGHVCPESLLYYRGSCIRAVATAIAVGCVRTGPVCTPCRSCCRRGLCSHRVMFAHNRCYNIVGIVYTLSLLLSPWVMFAPGLCSPVIVVIACHCRGWKPCPCCSSTLCQCPVPPHGLHPARRTGTVVGYVRTCPLLSLVVVGIGPCSWRCAVRSSLPLVWGVTRRILRTLLRWVLCVIINKQWAGVLVRYVGLRYRR